MEDSYLANTQWKWLALGEKDVWGEQLFEIDPKNKESRILYDTEGNDTLIIGYRDGKVYLLQDLVVYEMEPEGGEKTKLLTFWPEDYMYYIDWVGDALFIRTSEKIVVGYFFE